MSRRLLVNDALNQLGERTFWNDLQEWFGMEFVPLPFNTPFGKEAVLPPLWNERQVEMAPDLIIRNATYFPPLVVQAPTISLLQDIIPEGPLRTMQEGVIKSSARTVFNSGFTASKYHNDGIVIPLPVDFATFEPQNAMGCQQALSLPAGCVCWIGASQGAAGHIKGFDIFLQIVRLNPDIPFVAVFKDAIPESFPPNMRCYAKLTHAELVKVIGACSVGLCTSRMESQHLAGIEMGACGLQLVVPEVGIYWGRRGSASPMFPGRIVTEPTPQGYIEQLRPLARTLLETDRQLVSSYWRREFDKPSIRAAWTKLVEEVENV